jgi:hypothetical protein
MTTKRFHTASVLTLIDGIVYEEFGKVCELAEWVMGHPIWTHEYADRDLAARIKSALVKQHPKLADFAKGSEEHWKDALARAEKTYGKTLLITKGDEERMEGPLTSLQRIIGDKP